MRYFQRLAENVSVLPILHSVIRNPDWWNLDTARTSFDNSPHAQASDIILRSCQTDGRSLSEAYVDIEAEDRDIMSKVKGAKAIALDLMHIVGGSRLGRLIITKTEPGKKIAAHKDEGPYADYYSRYHIVLNGLPGSLFGCGDETVCMQTGEIWWFDHKAEHWLANNSKDDRVHLIADIRNDP